MKALITGVNGFVGAYLKAELIEYGYETAGTDLFGGNDAIEADLLDIKSVTACLEKTEPDVIFHLAGQSSVMLSWKNPRKTFDVNVGGTLNLLDAVRFSDREIRVIVVGSSDEYGRVAEADCPIKETQALHPVNPYAASKLAAENMAEVYARAYGMDIIATRSFNHTGPGQGKGFVIPDFCSQIAEMEKSGESRIGVGNLNARRDFSDVRDVVRAYRLLAERGTAGEVYNVGAGDSYEVGALLNKLAAFSTQKIEIYTDEAKLRPVDLPLIEGDIKKLKSDTGYKPVYDIDTTLKDTLNYWRGVKGKR